MKMYATFLVFFVFTFSSLVQTNAGEDYHDHGGSHKEENQQDIEHLARDAHEAHNDHKAHDHGEEIEHSNESRIFLSAAQRALAQIRVEKILPQRHAYSLYAPGEILSNDYTSYLVTPRVPSIVLRRHTALGAHVVIGQPLVTLFSDRVAEAQSNFLQALTEWNIVQGLGRQSVGEQRYVVAKSQLDTAKATLKMIGISPEDYQNLSQTHTSGIGEYTLRAEIDGAVLRDEFEQGQRVEAGELLFKLADEHQLWVEAHLPAKQLIFGDKVSAIVKVGKAEVSATLAQEAHTIDAITRTRTVRLLVDNAKHNLHSGQFADVNFHFQSAEPVMAVPEGALVRDGHGDWAVFLEQRDNEFVLCEVELGQALGKVREVRGFPPGSRVVTQGAFFVASQIAKSGFDPHNH